MAREGAGVGAGEAAGDEFFSSDLSIAFTYLRSRRVAMPRRLYQIPSSVCHTSSASTFIPLVSRIVIGPCPVFSSPPVDTIPELKPTGIDSTLVAGDGIGLGDGDGSGEGDSLGDGDGREGKTGIDCWVTVPFAISSLAFWFGASRVNGW